MVVETFKRNMREHARVVSGTIVESTREHRCQECRGWLPDAEIEFIKIGSTQIAMCIPCGDA